MLLLLLPMRLGDAALDAREFDEHFDEIGAGAGAAEVLHDDTGAAAHDKRIDEVAAVEDSRS